ncbi:glycosyltransferase family 4 protein [Algoriphagus sp. NG3]|uniref:glycosyltransferase family 4 protein n=1 Tax=Algoriphagus sp. NG3 TaxID=3097546 RepID=UPI002A814E77|nr:glycosyltransferase family 4 protein [Algoriphagus sp. NG3]WPR77797.1 glycosyltransferase family 4 protein [Algoriphagus sp. NG3]
MRLIYIGNKLAGKGFNPTTIDTLGEILAKMHPTVFASEKKNTLLRFIDMGSTIIKYRKGNPLVLIDTYSTSAFNFVVLSAVICRIYKIRYIPYLHGGSLKDRLESSPLLSKFVFDKAYRIISPSGFLREVFREKGFKGVSIFPNFINIEKYPFKRRDRLRPKILWVRSFHEIYNPQRALLVLLRVLKFYPEAELCMVGPDKDGSLEKVKAEASTLGIADQVKFTGGLSKEEWIMLSENYDIFLNTTDYDNTPVSVMEAMALGMCVISTKVGGIPYLFEDGVEGFMVDLEIDERFSDYVLKLLASPELSKSISINARMKSESWDWEIVKKLWIELLGK